jgi:hypothetical protein
VLCLVCATVQIAGFRSVRAPSSIHQLSRSRDYSLIEGLTSSSIVSKQSTRLYAGRTIAKKSAKAMAADPVGFPLSILAGVKALIFCSWKRKIIILAHAYAVYMLLRAVIPEDTFNEGQQSVRNAVSPLVDVLTSIVQGITDFMKGILMFIPNVLKKMAEEDGPQTPPSGRVSSTTRQSTTSSTNNKKKNTTKGERPYKVIGPNDSPVPLPSPSPSRSSDEEFYRKQYELAASRDLEAAKRAQEEKLAQIYRKKAEQEELLRAKKAQLEAERRALLNAKTEAEKASSQTKWAEDKARKKAELDSIARADAERENKKAAQRAAKGNTHHS